MSSVRWPRSFTSDPLAGYSETEPRLLDHPAKEEPMNHLAGIVVKVPSLEVADRSVQARKADGMRRSDA